MNHNVFSRKKAGQKSTISVKLKHALENMLTAEHTVQPMASIC